MHDSTSRVARALHRSTAGLTSLGTTLVVLCLGMVVGSFVVPSPPRVPDPQYLSLDPSSPVRLVIPSLELRAPIVPVALTTGRVLDPPRDPLVVGWWRASAQPGASTGQTVITGHTVHTGGGAMDSIDTVRPGGRVDVVTRAGTMRYRVTDVQVLDKDAVARQSVSLFGQQAGDGRLVLISCDDWNGEYYESNVVVLGEPLGQPLPAKADTGPELAATS